MSTLKGQVAIVTGAGQGIGRGIALALADDGAAVMLVGRTQSKLDAVAGEIAVRGGRSLSMQCDVADRAEVDAAVEATVGTFGRIDVLINNAQALAPNRPLVEVSQDDLRTVWESGAVGTLNFMQSSFPHLRQRGGSVVNMGSNTGIEGSAFFGPYVMAKEAIRGLTRVAAREWGRFGIRVNVVCPFGESPAAAEWNASRPDLAATILKNTSLGRIGDCEADIGRGIAALVGSDLSYLTGATLMLDGGLTILH